MKFGINSGFGIPFYLNGLIVGWVCASVNSAWMVIFRGANNAGCIYSEPKFRTRLEAELYLMGAYGE